MEGRERYVDDTRREEMKADRLAEQKSTRYERRKGNGREEKDENALLTSRDGPMRLTMEE